MKIRSILAVLAVWTAAIGSGNVINEAFQVVVGPSDGRWTVDDGVGDGSLSFDVRVLRYNVPVSDDSVTCLFSIDNMAPYATERVALTDGKATVTTPRPDAPGFVRCKAVYGADDGRKYTGLATVGVSPEKIVATQTMPADFESYWQSTLERARRTPLDPKMSHRPELSTNAYDVYSVSYAVGNGNGRMYGVLTVPKGDGPFPAVVHYPGAGVYAIGPLKDLASKGIITLCIGVNGIPVDMDDDVYAALGSGPLKNYPMINLDDRDRYYYNRVITGAVRAVDFVLGLPGSNGSVGTYGGSQGGFLSLAVAALHPSVKALVANFPAMSDHTGYTHGRSGGWPHVLRDAGMAANPNVVNTLRYYDAVNFARLVRVPGWYAHGYNDLTCPPTAVTGVFNAIGAPKTVHVMPTAGHALFLEDRAASYDWILGL